MKPGPIARSYWVEPERLVAGAYPGHPDPQQAQRNVDALLAAGVRTFVNLMEPQETDHQGRRFAPYAPLVEARAAARDLSARCLRFPIQDLGIPGADEMREIQAALDAAADAGGSAYVHCWGGRGRTGTVVGVYLLRRGLATTEDFVEVIARLRVHDAGGGPSPETRRQVAFVREVGSGEALMSGPVPRRTHE